MLRQLKHTQWRWLLLALLVVQLQVVLSALRWRMTATRLGQSLKRRRAIAEYYLATVANLTMPGGVTGDAARVFRNRQSSTLSISLQAVMLERMAGQIALMVIALVGWLLGLALFPGNFSVFAWRAMIACGSILSLLILGSWLTIRFAPKQLAQPVQAFRSALVIVWLQEHQWLFQGLISLAIAATYLVVFWCCSYAVQTPLSVIQAISIVPLVLLSMMIPLSVGGWGIRESAAAVLWPVVSLTAEAGIATSILYALVSLLACLPGLFLLALPQQPTAATITKPTTNN